MNAPATLDHVSPAEPAVPVASTVPAQLSTTPNLILGPFYPVNAPADVGADLLAGLSGRIQDGQVLILSGRVLNRAGQAVPNALVEIWQADESGRYPHTSAPPPAPADSRFTGYGLMRTGTDGAYQFRTLRPGAYLENGQQRAPHIHFQVTGQYDRLVTQVFFPDEPLYASDHWFRAVTRPMQLLAKRVSVGTPELHLLWDIVLRNG